MIKKLTIRLKGALYNKLRIYAEDNDLTIVGAIRFIINQFLNKIQ